MPPVSSVTSASIRMLPGPVSKASTASRSPQAGSQGHVADAADVLDAAVAGFVAERGPVEVGRQRRALPADRHVRDAEIGHDRRAGGGGDHGRLADLERRRHPRQAAGWRNLLDRLVPDRLAVRADHAQRGRIDAEPRAGRQRRAREALADDTFERAQPGNGGALVVIERQQLAANRSG